MLDIKREYVVATALLIVMGGFAAIASPRPGTKPSVDPLTSNPPALIDHAYTIFRHLTSGKVPAWEHRELGWRDQCDVDLTQKSCAASPVVIPEAAHTGSTGSKTVRPMVTLQQILDFHFAHSLTIPPQFRTFAAFPAGDTFSFPVGQAGPGFPAVLQTIYYNRSAARTISREHLDDVNVILSRREALIKRSAPLQDMQVHDFSSDAIVVKTFWETIQPSQLPGLAINANLWQKGKPPDLVGRYSSLTAFSDDNFVDLTKEDSCSRTTVDHDDSGNPGIHPVYSLGCFYHRRVGPGFAAHSEPSAQHDISDPFCDVSPGQHCYLILVGVHVMTRETPNWLWMTFWWSTEWWSSHPNHANVRNRWMLFHANATANNTDPVANPYLEGITSGMASNCLECHRHAVVHPGYGSVAGPSDLIQYFSGVAGTDSDAALNFDPATSHPDGLFPPLKPEQIPSVARDINGPPCYFSAALQTHFLWTIALHSTSGPNLDPCKDGPDAPTRNQTPLHR